MTGTVVKSMMPPGSAFMAPSFNGFRILRYERRDRGSNPCGAAKYKDRLCTRMNVKTAISGMSIR